MSLSKLSPARLASPAMCWRLPPAPDALPRFNEAGSRGAASNYFSRLPIQEYCHAAERVW